MNCETEVIKADSNSPYKLLPKFIQVCSTGNIREFYDLLSNLSIDQKNNLIEFDRYASFHIAVANGHFEIVKSLLEYVKSVTDKVPAEEAVIPIFLAQNGAGFKAALTHQHIKTVELLLEEEYLFNDCLEIIGGNPAFINTIWHSPLKHCILYLFNLSCAQDLSHVESLLKRVPESAHTFLLDFISDEYVLTDKLIIASSCPFKTACHYGKLEILQFLWNTFSPSHRDKVIKAQFPACCVMAAKQGYLDIIKQLAAWLTPEQKIEFLTSIDFTAFIFAADKGYVEIMQFIWESLPPSLRFAAIAASNFATYRLATKNQHTRVIAFLEANTPKETREKMQKAVTQSVNPPK